MSNQTGTNPPDTFEMSERTHEDIRQTSSITNNETANLGVLSTSPKIISSLLLSNKMSSTNSSNLFLSSNNNNNANQLNKSNASSKENDEDRVDDLNSLTPKVLSLNDEEIENNNNNNEEEEEEEEEESLSKITTTTNGMKLHHPTPDKNNVDLSINVENNNNNNENEFELKSHEIIRARFESDFILCIVAFVFVFALHVSTLFTVLKPFYLLDVLILLGFIVGIFSSYIMPHLRLENPWYIYFILNEVLTYKI